ncbi:MAG TPA: hypothetical protein DD451_00225 [Candidatus Moranbacteria bacterium]|nr:hypothetical protein [Candidatus Moranbacteria bacterium]
MKKAFQKTLETLKISLPIIIGILMLISIINPLFEKYYPKIFTGNYFIDPLIGAVAGSISFGIPIASYVTGGELLKEGVSLLAVTAFILAWSTVGVMFMPLEISNLGKKFAIWRNSLNFISSIIIAILTIITLKIIL